MVYEISSVIVIGDFNYRILSRQLYFECEYGVSIKYFGNSNA